MKRVLSLLVVVFVFGIAVNCFAGGGFDYYDRITLSAKGEFIYHINFPFLVPSGNCNQLDVYKYNKSFSFFGTEASWELLPVGTVVQKGIYKFINRETGCDLNVSIEGAPNNVTIPVNSWTGLEVEPEDLGLFVKNGWTSDNIFNLSEDDAEYSYLLIFNQFGQKTSIGVLLSNSFNFAGDIVGAIIPNKRGLLGRKVFFDETNKYKNMIINESEAEFHWVKKMNKKVYIGILAGLIILLLGTLGFLVWKILTINQKEAPSNVISTKELLSPVTNLVENKLFYIKENNVHSKDIKTGEVKIWTSFANNEKIIEDANSNPLVTYIPILQVIDSENVGFLKCEAEFVDTFNLNFKACNIMLLNLNNSSLEEVKYSQSEETKDPYSKIQAVAWFNKDKFAVIKIGDNLDKYRIYIVENGVAKLIKESKINPEWNEYGVPERLSFSPNGEYVFYWSIMSPQIQTGIEYYAYFSLCLDFDGSIC